MGRTQFAINACFLVLSILGLAHLFSGCGGEGPAPMQPEQAKAIWVSDESYFRAGKILLNANVSQRKFIVAGLNRLTIYDSTLAQEKASGLDLHKGIIQELDNTGLEGNEITSVNQHDGKIWVTTLSGMFTKDVKDFFTFKESQPSQALPGKIVLLR